MTLRIEISSDTAAFDDEPEFESARILRDIATQVESGYDGGTVRDINGNSVGCWSFKDRED